MSAAETFIVLENTAYEILIKIGSSSFKENGTISREATVKILYKYEPLFHSALIDLWPSLNGTEAICWLVSGQPPNVNVS